VSTNPQNPGVSFVCTAAAIDREIVVTAAHCLMNEDQTLPHVASRLPTTFSLLKG